MFKRYLLPCFIVLLAGCSVASPSAHAPGAVTAADTTGAVVTNSLMGGTKSVAITIAPPQEGAFASQGNYRVMTVQHHWTANDVYQYTANLKLWNGTAYADFTTPLNIVIPQKGTGAKTKAVFTNLSQGQKYQVQLTAQGNDGGTAATSTLDNNTATTSIFDFTATQDVQDTLAATLTVTFDQVAFSGTGTATVGAPPDGTYLNPAAAATGTAQ